MQWYFSESTREDVMTNAEVVAALIKQEKAGCEHPADSVSADILEGDYTGGVQWCRLCGAYRRFSYAGGRPDNFGEWRVPAK